MESLRKSLAFDLKLKIFKNYLQLCVKSWRICNFWPKVEDKKDESWRHAYCGGYKTSLESLMVNFITTSRISLELNFGVFSSDGFIGDFINNRIDDTSMWWVEINHTNWGRVKVTSWVKIGKIRALNHSSRMTLGDLLLPAINSNSAEINLNNLSRKSNGHFLS